MYAMKTEKTSLVWKGVTPDNYTLLLSKSGLKRIISQLSKQPKLKNFIKINYKGNLKQAVVRSVAQLARNSCYRGSVFHPNLRRKLRIFASQDAAGQNYQIYTLPLSRIQSGIITIRPLESEIEWSEPLENTIQLQFTQTHYPLPEEPQRKALELAKTNQNCAGCDYERLVKDALKLQRGKSTAGMLPDASYRGSPVEITLEEGQKGLSGRKMNQLATYLEQTGNFVLVMPFLSATVKKSLDTIGNKVKTKLIAEARRRRQKVKFDKLRIGVITTLRASK